MNGHELSDDEIEHGFAEGRREAKRRGLRKQRGKPIIVAHASSKKEMRQLTKLRRPGHHKSQRRFFDEQLALLPNGRRRRNVEGFEAGGVFHPIRGSEGYNEFLAGDFDSPQERAERSLQRDAGAMRAHYEREQKEMAREFERKHKSLSQFVRAAGGIAYKPETKGERGELKSKRGGATMLGMLSRKETGTTGLLNQKNREGSHRYSASRMMEAANAEGYRDRGGERFTHYEDFLRAVADDASGGRKIYSQRDLERYEFANPMKGKGKVTCSRCGGSHHVNYCNARSAAKPTQNGLTKREYNFEVHTRRDGIKHGTVRARSGQAALAEVKKQFKASGIVKSRAWRVNPEKKPSVVSGQSSVKATRNFLGLDRASRIKRAKRRARVSSAKASLLEAKERLKRARKNPSITPSMAQEMLATNKSLADLVESRVVQITKLMKSGKYRAKTPLLFKDGKLIDGRHRLAAVVRSGMTIEFPIESVVSAGAQQNPMHPLEIGSHLAMILSGVHTAGEMTKRKPRKKRRPSASAAGKRLAQRKHGSVRGKTKIVKRKVRNGHEPGKIFEEFSGMPSTRVTSGYVAANSPVNIDGLGERDVVQITLETPHGKPVQIGSARDGTERTIRGEVVKFNPGALRLCAVETNGGRRRFVTTVRKADRAKWLAKNPAFTGNYKRGVLAEIVYRARKPHLHNGSKRVNTYYHIVGEEGGRRPTAYLMNGCPTFRYGAWQITAAGIRD